jgi:hypothetical protein
MAKGLVFAFSTIVLIAQAGSAAAIIPIIWFDLSNITWTERNFYGTCLLSPDATYFGACTYGYALASVSLCFTLISSCLLCCSVLKRKIAFVAIVTDFLAFVWWVIGGIVLHGWSVGAISTGLPHEYWRTVIEALAWTLCGLFGLKILMDANIASSKDRKRVQSTQTLPQTTPVQPIWPIQTDNQAPFGYSQPIIHSDNRQPLGYPQPVIHSDNQALVGYPQPIHSDTRPPLGNPQHAQYPPPQYLDFELPAHYRSNKELPTEQ